MKTMTCKQLGGPCDNAYHTNTADEAIKAQDAHLKERAAAGDESHKEASDAMAKRWKNPFKGMGWYLEMKKLFKNLPED